MISGEILPLVDEMARYRYKQIRTAPSNKREITSGINCLGLYYVLPALVYIYLLQLLLQTYFHSYGIPRN